MRPPSVAVALFLGAGLAVAAQPAAAQAAAATSAASSQVPIKTVYHLTNGLDEASRGLGNIRNHLAADPTAKITVVTNGNGIEFLLEGAKDRNGNPYDVIVQDLKSKGVDFRVCNNTLVSRKIDPAKVIPEASIVPSGVAEAAKLQAREGYVYLRP
ncbi:MAG TPA: DsrE family protein [Burkholderiaceae bacterium]|nr:DsrE family protein [Burkholderiaceae bacterium]HQR70712.1 DsrE family protein [Burkholderiaceae bacterium]